jgi:hypothetical protein
VATPDTLIIGGYLDHALSCGTLTPQVVDTTAWHINADEPDILDYDTSFKSDGQDALYEPDPYRPSDHDPVNAGLDLNRHRCATRRSPIRTSCSHRTTVSSRSRCTRSPIPRATPVTITVCAIAFTATDTFGGSSTDEVTVAVPVGRRGDAIDDGPQFDATVMP